jgi:hypothetical protein
VAGIEDLPDLLADVRPPVLLCLLGNTFSNFEPDELLATVAGHLAAGDSFLFDCHLAPDAEADVEDWRRRVEAAYGSDENARFNLGPLTSRGVDPAACRFSLRLRRVPTPHGPAWRTHKTIEMLADAEASFASGPLALPAGRVIEMGFTYKHTRGQVIDHVRRHGLDVVKAWTDAAGGNLLVLARRPKGDGDESDRD